MLAGAYFRNYNTAVNSAANQALGDRIMSQGPGNRPPPIPTGLPVSSGSEAWDGARKVGANGLGTVLAGIALLVAIVAIIIAITIPRHPLGKGMSGYDFTSPSATVKSLAAARANNDVLVMIELDQLQSDRFAAEKLRTLEIKKEVTSNGKKVVFVSYLEDGVKKHDTVSVEKDADSGLWIPARFSAVSDAAIRKDIEKWEESAKEETTTTEKN
jgi:hypothetical protein